MKTQIYNFNYHELSEFQNRITPLFAAAVNLPNVHLPLDFWKELV